MLWTRLFRSWFLRFFSANTDFVTFSSHYFRTWNVGVSFSLSLISETSWVRRFTSSRSSPSLIGSASAESMPRAIFPEVFRSGTHSKPLCGSRSIISPLFIRLLLLYLTLFYLPTNYIYYLQLIFTKTTFTMHSLLQTVTSFLTNLNHSLCPFYHLLQLLIFHTIYL